MLGLLWGYSRIKHRLGSKFRKALIGAACLWISAGLAFMTRHAVSTLSGGAYRQSDFPHLKHGLLPVLEYETVARQIETIRSLCPERKAFIIASNPGFYYLAADLRNPTPYDYTTIYVMGPRGEKRVMDMIDKGRIPMVFVLRPPSAWMYLWPRELVRYVETHMRKLKEEDSFSVYVPKDG
jgi:hypothetical protein